MLSFAIVSVACSGQKSNSENGAQAKTDSTAVDMHNAENSLDYAGIYKGTIPAASGPGIKVTLTLNKDMTYTMVSEYMGEKDATFTDTGKYTIDGNIAALERKDQAPLYLKVEEGRVRMLDAEKQVVTGPLENDYILITTETF